MTKKFLFGLAWGVFYCQNYSFGLSKDSLTFLATYTPNGNNVAPIRYVKNAFPFALFNILSLSGSKTFLAICAPLTLARPSSKTLGTVAEAEIATQLSFIKSPVLSNTFLS